MSLKLYCAYARDCLQHSVDFEAMGTEYIFSYIEPSLPQSVRSTLYPALTLGVLLIHGVSRGVENTAIKSARHESSSRL